MFNIKKAVGGPTANLGVYVCNVGNIVLTDN